MRPATVYGNRLNDGQRAVWGFVACTHPDVCAYYEPRVLQLIARKSGLVSAAEPHLVAIHDKDSHTEVARLWVSLRHDPE